MATKLLPAAKIGVKKKTISADSIRPNYLKKEEKPLEASERSSTREILLSIRDFITAKFKRGVSSFTMKRREKQKERIEAREKNIENKEGKLKLGNLIKPPKFVGNIFSSITNFLLVVAGGILFNILGLEKSLMAIEKTLEIIGKGVQIFANIVGMFTNFIDSAVRGYDEFLQKIEDVTGFDKTKIEKFMEDFKYVINGAIIAGIFALRALPSLMRRKCLPNNLRNKGPNINSNRRNNRINNRRTTSGGQQLNRGRFSGMKESLRNIRNRIPFLNPNVSQGSNVVNRNLSKLNPVNPKISKGSNIFTRNLSKLNPFNNKITGSKPSFKLPKIPKIPGLGMLGKSLGKFLGPLFFAIDFGGRKGEGQTNIQAGAGAGAAQAGFWSGSAVAAKLLSPLLVTPVPGARILYGVSVFGAGILGSMGLTSVTDTITGANKDVSKKESIFEVSSSGSDETAVNLLKNIKSIDDLATNTSYSQGSYGLITEINNFIQPVVQEV